MPQVLKSVKMRTERDVLFAKNAKMKNAIAKMPEFANLPF